MAVSGLDVLVHHLRAGTLPDGNGDREVCLKISMYFAAFALYSREHKRSISIHVMDTRDEQGFALPSVHATWTTLVIGEVAKHLESLTGEFNGVAVKGLTETMELYVAYTDILQHTCSWCKQTYSSDVNRCRCENSHVSRKNLDERSVLPIGVLAQYWDSLDEPTRKSIAAKTTRYLIGIPNGAQFSANVCALIKLAAGHVGIDSSKLMIALDEASEYTFLFRPARVMKRMAILHRADFVAAIADEFITTLAQHHADSVTELLLSESSQPPANNKRVSAAKKKKKRVRAKKEPPRKKSFETPEVHTPTAIEDSPAGADDVQSLLQREIQKQIELENEYSQEAYLCRLEKTIFSTPAIVDIRSWADM